MGFINLYTIYKFIIYLTPLLWSGLYILIFVPVQLCVYNYLWHPFGMLTKLYIGMLYYGIRFNTVTTNFLFHGILIHLVRELSVTVFSRSATTSHNILIRYKLDPSQLPVCFIFTLWFLGERKGIYIYTTSQNVTILFSTLLHRIKLIQGR